MKNTIAGKIILHKSTTLTPLYELVMLLKLRPTPIAKSATGVTLPSHILSGAKINSGQGTAFKIRAIISAINGGNFKIFIVF